MPWYGIAFIALMVGAGIGVIAWTEYKIFSERSPHWTYNEEFWSIVHHNQMEDDYDYRHRDYE